MNILTQLAQTYTTYQSYDYTSTSEADPAVMAGILALYAFVFLGAYVVGAIFTGMIFKKAGVPAWAAWVPFYNNWKLLELGGQQGFWAVLAILPIVSIVSAVFTYIAMYHIGLKLGKSGAFVLWAIFLPIVWLIWLATDKSQWNDAASPAAPSKVPPAPTAA